MCNWFQNKSPTHTFAVDWDTWHGNWAAPCYFNGASPTGSARWGYCLQRHLACEGLYSARHWNASHRSPFSSHEFRYQACGTKWAITCARKSQSSGNPPTGFTKDSQIQFQSIYCMVPTVETSRPRVVDNCAFIGFCVLDWAVPRATKII